MYTRSLLIALAARAGRRPAVLFAGIGLAGALARALVRPWQDLPSDAADEQQLLSRARAALARKDYDLAEELALRIEREGEFWGPARLVAGEAATEAGRLAEALEHYLSLAKYGRQRDDAAAGHFYAAEIYCELGQLTEAEQAYREVLASQPDNAATHERLAFLLAVTGRRWESRPHYGFLAPRLIQWRDSHQSSPVMP